MSNSTGVQPDGSLLRRDSASENYLTNRLQAVPGYRQQWSLQMLDVNAIARSGMLVQVMTGVSSPPTASHLSPGEVRAINADFARCVSQTRQPVRKTHREGLALQRLWAMVTGDIYRSSAVSQADREFGSCVMERGAPQVAAGSPQQFHTWLDSVVNPPGWARGNLPSAPRAALDARWTTVWAHCAVPVVSVWQRLMLARQKAFLQAHYQQVSALEQQVARSLAQLQKMGAQG